MVILITAEVLRLVEAAVLIQDRHHLRGVLGLYQDHQEALEVALEVQDLHQVEEDVNKQIINFI